MQFTVEGETQDRDADVPAPLSFDQQNLYDSRAMRPVGFPKYMTKVWNMWMCGLAHLKFVSRKLFPHGLYDVSPIGFDRGDMTVIDRVLTGFCTAICGKPTTIDFAIVRNRPAIRS